MEVVEDIQAAMESCAKKNLGPQFKEAGITPLPPTPEQRPAKKAKSDPGCTGESNSAAMMKMMERMEGMQVETLRTAKANTVTINSLVDRLDAMDKRMEDVTGTVSSLQSRVKKLEKDNSLLRDRCSELDAYKRRWNLRVAGIQEKSGENVKQIIINLFGKVSPDIANQLPATVDIVHRLGPRSGNAQSFRRIIVQFISRTHRDKIWRDARNSDFLKQQKIKLFEDLPQDTKDARNKLWPSVEKARKEGKKAGFRGPLAVIEGKRFSVNDI